VSLHLRSSLCKHRSERCRNESWFFVCGVPPIIAPPTCLPSRGLREERPHPQMERFLYLYTMSILYRCAHMYSMHCILRDNLQSCIVKSPAVCREVQPLPLGGFGTWLIGQWLLACIYLASSGQCKQGGQSFINLMCCIIFAAVNPFEVWRGSWAEPGCFFRELVECI
jgi:hypothetical protein